MQLYRRGRILWCKFKFRGQTYRESTGQTNRRAAAAQARQIRARIEAEAGPGVGPGGLRLDVLEALDIARCHEEGLGPRRILTIEGLWSPLLRHLGEARDVTTLTVTDVRVYMGARREDGCRGQTIRREVQALKRCIKIAKRDGALARDPIEWDELGRIRSDKPNARQSSKAWTAREVQVILGKLSKRAVTAGWRDRLRLIQFTGLRLEELRRLRPSWVVGSVLMVPSTGSKTDDARAIPLGREACAILRRWTTKGSDAPPFARGKPNRALEAACARAGVRGVLTPRDLRAWYISETAAVDVVAAQRLAGHRSLATTSRYVNAEGRRLLRAARAAAAAAKWGTGRGTQRKPASGKSRIKSSERP